MAAFTNAVSFDAIISKAEGAFIIFAVYQTASVCLSCDHRHFDCSSHHWQSSADPSAAMTC